MTDVLIRRAEASDADALFPLLQQFATRYRPDRAAFDTHLGQLLAADHAEVLVACVDEEAIGYLLAFHLLTLYANGVVIEVQELIVAPGWRRRGIGGRLVKTVVERGRTTGSVEITVPTRRAEVFYTSLGFEPTASYLKLALGP